MYVRKTVDEWHTQGDYGCGWETVTIADTREEGLRDLRDYRENERGIPHRLIKKRVRKERGENA